MVLVKLKSTLQALNYLLYHEVNKMESKLVTTLESLFSCFAGVVARVEKMRSQQAEGERQVENLFQSLLAESFGGAV